MRASTEASDVKDWDSDLSEVPMADQEATARAAMNAAEISFFIRKKVLVNIVVVLTNPFFL